MVPSIVWTLVYCISTMTIKGPLTFLTFYWYLFSLFTSFCIILLFCKIFKNNIAVIVISTMLVLLMPYSDVANLNFMFPFLWIGYFLRVAPPKHSNYWFVAALVTSFAIMSIWDWDYTIYLSRFNIISINPDMLLKYAVRFIVGCTASYVVIWLAQKFESSTFVRFSSKYGKYTLTCYLASLVLFGVIRKYAPINIEEPILLESLSLLLCVFTYALCIGFQTRMERQRILRVLFLGIR